MRLLLGLLAISVLLIFFLLVRVRDISVGSLIVPAPINAPSTPTPTLVPISGDKLFTIVNEWRQEKDYQPYIKSGKACEIATERVKQVSVTFSHDGFYQKINNDPELVKSRWAENISEGYSFNEQILNAWIASPTHYENLIDSYTHSCIKCDSGYCVHIFSYF
jgi:uncharacterized protein YkwD